MICGKRHVPLLLATLTLVLPLGTRAQVLEDPGDGRTGGLGQNEAELAPLESRNDMPERIPSEKAINAYNRGLDYRNKAWKLEEQADTAEGEKAVKKAAKAQKYYKDAIKQFRIAIDLVPEFHQALGSLGYALLKTGNYEEALESYDRALTIGPRYPEAIAERGEAYLGLNRLEEAKDAYLKLFEADRRSAAKLMTAMERWLEERANDDHELSAETIEAFAAWIAERS